VWYFVFGWVFPDASRESRGPLIQRHRDISKKIWTHRKHYVRNSILDYRVVYCGWDTIRRVFRRRRPKF
jgi:hypothetical protein